MAGDEQEHEDDSSILNDERLLRRVHHKQVKPDGKPDSSIFKNDPKGIGTSLTVWRTDDDITAVLAGRDHVGLVWITAAHARELGFKLVFTHEPGNPHHCEMVGPRNEKKQRKLRDKVAWLTFPLDDPRRG